MSTYSVGEAGTHIDRDLVSERRPVRRATTETRPAFKTTEIVFYLLTVAGVLIASALVDQDNGQGGFGAERAWLYVTMLTIGYMVSRGLAKAGSHQSDNDPRN